MTSVNVEMIRRGDRLTFQVSGDLDYLSDRTVLGTVLEGMRDRNIVALDLDLSELGFCDSTGLGTLITIHSHATDRGVSLVLLEPRTALLRLLTLTGLESVFTIRAKSGQPERAETAT